MITIPHSLQFVTELDETHPVAKQLLALPTIDQVAMLEAMLKELLAPRIQSALDELNAGNSKDLVFEFSEWFASDNPRFDENKFWDACTKEIEVNA